MQMYPNYGYALHMNMPFLVTVLVSIISYFHILNIYRCCVKLTWDHVIDPFFYKISPMTNVNTVQPDNLITVGAFGWKEALLT